MPLLMLGTLLSLIDVVPLFSDTAWGHKVNLDFLNKHMGLQAASHGGQLLTLQMFIQETS
jgi:hypothetical protein